MADDRRPQRVVAVATVDDDIRRFSFASIAAAEAVAVPRNIVVLLSVTASSAAIVLHRSSHALANN